MAEASMIVGISRNTLKRAVRDGRLTAVRAPGGLRRDWSIEPVDLEQYRGTYRPKRQPYSEARRFSGSGPVTEATLDKLFVVLEKCWREHRQNGEWPPIGRFQVLSRRGPREAA